MARTFLNFPFDEELFMQAWAEEPDPVKTELLKSGVMVEDAQISGQIAGGGNFYTVPFYKPLSGTPGNYDGSTNVPVEETSADCQSGIVYGRTQGFMARDFVADLSGSDPMGHIAASVARFWNRYRQSVLIKIMSAIFNITTPTDWKNNHTIEDLSVTANAAKITATHLNDLATQSCGDNKSIFQMAIMHSNVAKTLENLQLLEYWKQTDANGIQRPINLASCNGYTVVVDDSVPVEAVGGADANKNLKKYTTYLLGTGVLRHANGKLDKPGAVPVRDEIKNGGQETLVTRIRETIHPNGFSFKVPTTGWSESPTDAQLALTANWSCKFDPKAIPIARLITNG
ncbi:MAG: coat protein [Eubacterium sp.]